MHISSTGIVLFAHGSRDPGWRTPIEAVRTEIERSRPGAQVRCAYLELCEPTLAQAVQSLLAEGVHSLSVVPMFLGTGRHAREDLPLLIAALQAEHAGLPIALQRAVGEDPRLTALMAQIAFGESLELGDTVPGSVQTE